MTPSTEIIISDSTIAAIRNQNEEIEDLFTADLMLSKELIYEFLDEYAKEREARATIDDFFEIEGLEIGSDGLGVCIINFSYTVYNGCRDMEGNFDLDTDVAIEIDFETKIAVLTGDDLMPERDPDEF